MFSAVSNLKLFTGTHFAMGVVHSIYKEKGLVEPNSLMNHINGLEFELPTILRLLSGKVI